jgi:hypothetical protein
VRSRRTDSDSRLVIDEQRLRQILRVRAECVSRSAGRPAPDAVAKGRNLYVVGAVAGG